MATLRESLGGKAFAINRVAVSVQYNVTQTDTEVYAYLFLYYDYYFGWWSLFLFYGD